MTLPPLTSTGRLAKALLATSAIVAAASVALPAQASSHREAPGITEMPKVDGSDFYMFRSYEPGREGFVTFIANYQPVQAPYGGPNYFTMDPDALYQIHIDNDGDAVEDITYSFKFDNNLVNGTGITLDIGGKTLPIPLRAAGQITAGSSAALGETETYKISVIEGDRRSGTWTEAAPTFTKPVDNIGNKTLPDYDAYANQYIYDVTLPGCPVAGKVFVGQRAEAFAVNLGEVFDLVNLVPLEGSIPQDRAANDDLFDANVTSIAMEVPISCVTGNGNGVIGGWTTASLPQASLKDPTPTYEQTELTGGAYVQVSRLSAPLVNEVVIGLPFKDLFNGSEPKDDAQAADFVTNPTLPALIDILFRDALGATSNIAPSNFPRTDLVAAFLTGFPGVNQQATVTGSEMMRLNTAIATTPQAAQSNLGVAGNDLAGFPNGRRPGDDTVDIALRVVMGALCHDIPVNGVPTNLGYCQPSDAPVGDQPFTDGAPITANDVQNAFPYLNTPHRGSPN
ncbi:MAG: DUF4331 domain-containing protein [Alphaproteobacteria bacterium]